MVCSAGTASASGPIVVTDNAKLMKIGKWLELYADHTNKLTIEQVQEKVFRASGQDVPNLMITPYTHWARFSVENRTGSETLLLELEYPTLDQVVLYEQQHGGGFVKKEMSTSRPYSDREFNHQNYIFRLNIPDGETRHYYLSVKADEQAQLPIYLSTETVINQKNTQRNFIFGIYLGIILVMALYNLFIFLTTRDSSYLIYVAYIVCVGLTQASQQGYTFRFLYPNNTWLVRHDTVFIPILNGITAALFIQSFLHSRERYPLGHKLLHTVTVFYILCFIPMFMDAYMVAQVWVQAVAMVGSLTAIFVGVKVHRTGFKPARYFLIAWGIFLTSVIIFVMRNFNLLPYNDFTYYALQVGSAAEVTLLSFALANKINIYRKEKEESAALALQVSQENEQLVREQNAVLEAKVQERTEELQSSNKELNKALSNLKSAQTQLVEAEKMASLGQLTAGIAHEINNPINFVTSNIKPLKLDFADLRSLLRKYEHGNGGAGEDAADVAGNPAF
ncbi:hypothetical protein MKQ70_31660 [Chitinophaga sedimenti]|uniref:7TM diverse intracellular signaling domain-containing protein n=1 Tax=Chitinophaga sedimenti TaxID=2033606 RepID=UPI0020052BC5|nr:7TM diverse intracellular signaling domain-containing protein [Chitinophaga sedimenti]MCK7559280.1 hypothetical protein [Chitinophaga sedimenti]